VLLAHWSQAGRSGWTLPGGGLQPGEHPAAAVVRELVEETGYQVEVGTILGVDSIVIPAAERLHATTSDQHSLRLIYRAHITGGRLRAEVDGTTDEAAWFSVPEIANLDRVPLVDSGLRLAGLAPEQSSPV